MGATGSRDIGDKHPDQEGTRSREMGDFEPGPETVDVRDMGDSRPSFSADALDNEQPHG